MVRVHPGVPTVVLMWKGDIMQVRVQADESQFGKCGCGRSPTGMCIGWHGLTDEQYRVQLAECEQVAYDDDQVGDWE